ncbi:MAG: hypothetical protein ACRC12_03045 [Holosporales bacterium]
MHVKLALYSPRTQDCVGLRGKNDVNPEWVVRKTSFRLAVRTAFFLTGQAVSHPTMNDFEAILPELFRSYRRIYDSSMREHKDSQMTLNSWKEIATTLGKEEIVCKKVCENLRPICKT